MPAVQNLSGVDLIVVTGGAGFIGSNIVLHLAKSGERVVVCDLFRSGEKWRNIASARLYDIVRPNNLSEWLTRHRDNVAVIVHMAAVSSTTEKDVDKFVETNIRLTLDLWNWCAAHSVTLIYASSAATYGDGRAGFSDGQSRSALTALRPLNAYGWSKHVVDRRVVDDVARGHATPRQWAGLKFFNVYGPNETHKGSMQSLVSKIFPTVRAGEPITLFKSHDPRYSDGGQQRDFMYVKDCVAVVSWLLRHPETSGLFNVGTRTARSFLDLVSAVGAAIGCTPEYSVYRHPGGASSAISVLHSRRHYEAASHRFRGPFYSLEDGVRDYLGRLS